MKKKLSINITSILPFVLLIALFIVFAIATKGQVFSKNNLSNLFNQSVAVIIAGLGMVFVAAIGGTDITHGSLVALSATFGSMAGAAFGYGELVPVTILTGLASGILLGFINTKLKVPSFMASLSLLIAYRALVNLLLKADVFIVPTQLKFVDGFAFKFTAVIVMIAVIGYIFKFTRFGVYIRSIGENENAIQHVGISVDKVKLAAFMISGLMAAVAAVFTLVRIGGTNNTRASGFEMKVMMGMFIGGIPVQGGVNTKIYKLVVGAPTIILLENGLVMCGATGGITQLVRGFVLLTAVFLIQYLNKKFAGDGNERRLKPLQFSG